MGGGALAAAVFAAALWWPRPEAAAGRPSVAATVIAPERRELPDGSIAEYPAGTWLGVYFEGLERRIELPRGEAHFEVKPDAARPFIVTAPGVAVRAVGTAFAVRAGEAATTVVVTHGRVSVSEVNHGRIRAGAALAFVDAGHAVRVDAAAGGRESTVASLGAAETAQQLAWRERRVEFSGAPLSEVLAFVNQHNRVKFVLAEPSLASVPLSGVFRLNDPDDLAGMLERGFGVTLTRREPDRIAIGKRD